MKKEEKRDLNRKERAGHFLTRPSSVTQALLLFNKSLLPQ